MTLGPKSFKRQNSWWPKSCSGSSSSITAHLEGSFFFISVRETPLMMISMPSCKEEKSPACIILITMSHLKNFFQENTWKRTKIQQRNYCSIKQTLPGGCYLRGIHHFWTKLFLPLITKHIFKYDSYLERKTCSQNLVHYDLQPNIPSRIKFYINAKRYLWGPSLLVLLQSEGKPLWLVPKCCFFNFYSAIWTQHWKGSLNNSSLVQNTFWKTWNCRVARKITCSSCCSNSFCSKTWICFPSSSRISHHRCTLNAHTIGYK